ncbi:MAG: hypothetical protein JKY27_13370 [Magnetovibrio sp.]|nr:hypothetical protein [Magnetovibrio sp.]
MRTSTHVRSLLGALALSAATLNAPMAFAASATLVMPDLCDDPSAVFDHEWATAKNQSEALFYMQADGTISAVTANAGAFNNYDTVYVAGHGGDDFVGGFTFAEFSDNFEAAHNNLPDEVFFAVCSAANGPNSLLKALNDQYGGNINTLYGGVSACALVGYGDPTLANAEYLINVTQSDANLYATIIDNITQKWAGAYPQSQNTYNQVCQARVDPFDQGEVDDFVDTVYTQFSQPPQSGNDEDSTNYLDLVSLNNGGDALFVCGASPNGSTVEVPCP